MARGPDSKEEGVSAWGNTLDPMATGHCKVHQVSGADWNRIQRRLRWNKTGTGSLQQCIQSPSPTPHFSVRAKTGGPDAAKPMLLRELEKQLLSRFLLGTACLLMKFSIPEPRSEHTRHAHTHVCSDVWGAHMCTNYTHNQVSKGRTSLPVLGHSHVHACEQLGVHACLLL